MLDVGTGSGAIALAIADEHPGARVTAIDVSRGRAGARAREHGPTGLDGRVRLASTTASGCRGAVAISSSRTRRTSTPADLDSLEPEVRDWEPREALVAEGVHEAVARRRLWRCGRAAGSCSRSPTGRPPESGARLRAVGYDEVSDHPRPRRRERVVEGAATTETFTTSDGAKARVPRRGTGRARLPSGRPGDVSATSAISAGSRGRRSCSSTLAGPAARTARRPRRYASRTTSPTSRSFACISGLEQIDLLGHSHGGVVAMRYAAAHPARVRRLVLASTLARARPPSRTGAMRGADGGNRRASPGTTTRGGRSSTEQAGRVRPPTRSSARSSCASCPSTPRGTVSDERRLPRQTRDEVPNGTSCGSSTWEIFTTFHLRREPRRIAAPMLVIAGDEDPPPAGVRGARSPGDRRRASVRPPDVATSSSSRRATGSARRWPRGCE